MARKSLDEILQNALDSNATPSEQAGFNDESAARFQQLFGWYPSTYQRSDGGSLETLQSRLNNPSNAFDSVQGEGIDAAAKPRSEQNFFERIEGDFEHRRESLREAKTRELEGEQGGFSTGLQTVGNVAGGIGDIIAEGAISAGRGLKGMIRAVTPDRVERAVGQGTKAILDSTQLDERALAHLQDIVGDYQNWKIQNPVLANNLESAGNVASILPVGKLLNATGRVGTAAVKGAGRTASKVLAKSVYPVTSRLGNVKQAAAEKIVGRALSFTNAQRANIAKPNVAGVSPEKWLLSRFGKEIGTKADDVVLQLVDHRTLSREALETGLKNVSSRISMQQSNKFVEALTYLKGELESMPVSTVRKSADLDFINQTLKKKDISLVEANEIKRLFDRRTTLFTKTNDVKSAKVVQNLKELRDEMKLEIELFAKRNGFADVAQLNKEIQVAREIEMAIAKRVDADHRLLDFAHYSTGFGAGALAGHPVLGLLVGVASTNPRVQLFTARFLSKKLSKSQIDGLVDGVIDAKTKRVLDSLAAELRDMGIGVGVASVGSPTTNE